MIGPLGGLVDRRGIRVCVHLVTVFSRDSVRRMVDAGDADELLYACKEAPDVAGRCETDYITRQQAAENRASPPLGQHHPVGRPGPRHVNPVVDRYVRH